MVVDDRDYVVGHCDLETRAVHETDDIEAGFGPLVLDVRQLGLDKRFPAGAHADVVDLLPLVE